MRFEQYEDVREYWRQIEGFLLADEAGNNLPLGILYALQGDSGADKQPFLGLVRDEEEIKLVLLLTPPYELVAAGEADEAALDTAVSYLLEKNIQVPGVVGENNLAGDFSRIWSEKADCRREIAMRQRIYVLHRINEMEVSPGRLRSAADGDFKLLQAWITASSLDMFGKEITADEAEAKARTALARSSIYLWEDGKPVSMAARTRPTRNGIVINGVYTPAEYRNRGYATACVLSLSRLLLSKGYKFISLYTDLANPTSNSIYQKIGFQPVSDSIVYEFK